MSEADKGSAVQQEEKQENKAPKLCIVCHDFYGNATTNNMCSKCYKKSIPKNTDNTTQSLRTTDIQDQLNSSKMSIEEIKEEETQQQLKADPSKCYICNKKVGLLGFECKCKYIFCKTHRLPEQHQCNYDFNTYEKDKLKKANPVIKSTKLERD